MNRQERDTICGVAERYQLSYSRVLGYAVRLDGFLFFDFEQARNFVNQRLNLMAITPEHTVVRWNRGEPVSKVSTGFFRGGSLVPVALIGSLGVAGVIAIAYGILHWETSEPTSSAPKQLVGTSSVPTSESRPTQILVDRVPPPTPLRTPDKIVFKGVAGTRALIQIAKSGETESQNRQVAQGDEVLNHWTVKSIATRPTVLTLHNERKGKQVEIHLNEGADLPAE